MGIHKTREQDPRRVVDIGRRAGEGRGGPDGGFDGDDLTRPRGDDDCGWGKDERVVWQGEDSPRGDENRQRFRIIWRCHCENDCESTGG